LELRLPDIEVEENAVELLNALSEPGEEKSPPVNGSVRTMFSMARD